MKKNLVIITLVLASLVGCASRPAPVEEVVETNVIFTPKPPEGRICANMAQQQDILNRRFSTAGIRVHRVDYQTLRLDIPCDVLFDFNRYEIKYAFYPTLNGIAEVLVQYPDSDIHIYGFTDSIGSYAYNLELSERRAMSAAQYFVNCGINPNRIVVQGFGESYPRASNRTRSGRQLNRRVEVYIRDKNSPPGYRPEKLPISGYCP